MRTKRLLSAVVLIGFFFGACSKDDNNPTNPTTPNSFQELNVAPTFDWSTSSELSLNIQGLPTVNPINRTLVILDQEGRVVHKETWQMSASGVVNLNLPAYMSEITVRYGAIEKVVAIESNGTASFSFIPTVVDDSNPAQNRYYKSPDNLPWALEVSSRFEYPKEKTDILDAYLDFANWAQSSGQ